MTRLPLLFGLFLSAAVTGVVFLLSLLARVTLVTLLYRALVVFFVFGLLGVGIGSILEVLLMPITKAQEEERLEAERTLEHPHVVEELGDLLQKPVGAPSSTPAGAGARGLRPVVLPRVTVEGGKVVDRGDSAVVS
ncbi:MAG: hypothetical protein OZSIB_1943 [Candidatus Ozemobacter sibiricus]|jgi:hypothetical protein|uniref:Uncharacterized protein n=1 Tax=Candidatus Ozemobacter sibiricus TaxID=2268124 RepID=A0A367ZII0_9BACT|nr:MAG: hypothetical protein OZSIB_1943 [Candidatus Ozemobacter sibiricus]